MKQHEEPVSPNGAAREVEYVLDRPGVAIGVAFDRDQVGSRRHDGIWRPPDFDVFVGGIDSARRVKQNLADPWSGGMRETRHPCHAKNCRDPAEKPEPIQCRALYHG